MIELNGKFNDAIVYTDMVENSAISQIIELCNQEVFKDGKIRIMPDVHAGKGCVIGFTADLGQKVIPNIVGVDIGCGMLTVELNDAEIDLKKLDEVINNFVPSGHNIHENPKFNFKNEINNLFCIREISKNGWNARRWNRQIGTLGGGNHFIEVNEDSNGGKYLVIHSGSRNLGKQIADYYQDLAVQLCSGLEEYFIKKDRLIEDYKNQGKRSEIQNALNALKREFSNSKASLPNELCYLEGKYRDDYLHDMKIAQEFAINNRETMAEIIVNEMDFNIKNIFHTVHNYIGEDNIIRKGSISAKEGERVLIPINMRDGSLLCVGKGNEEWNNSAPHGAGRLMSRSKAKEELNIEDFKNEMSDVYSTSVVESTLDEAPMAYKPIESILDNVVDTVDVVDILKPIYNYKSH